jgi:probable HAF family extracellular repeat protein
MSRYSSAIAVNDEGWIVGLAEDGNGVSHAALWRPGAYSGTYAATDLHTAGEAGSIAYALSATGKLVGVSEGIGGVSVPVQWTEQLVNGSLQFERTTLGSAGGALAINSSGTLVAGWTGNSPLAAAWPGAAATPTSLFTIDSQVFGINDNNLVVGIKKGEGFVEKFE